MEDISFALEEPYLEQETPQIGGSQHGQKQVHKDWEAWHECFFKDYFSEDPTYDAMKFHWRYRMRRELFLRLIDVVCCFDPWFIQKRIALWRLGFRLCKNVPLHCIC